MMVFRLLSAVQSDLSGVCSARYRRDRNGFFPGSLGEYDHEMDHPFLTDPVRRGGFTGGLGGKVKFVGA